MRAFNGFCLLNHFHKQIRLRHSKSDIYQKIVIEGLKRLALALISLSTTTNLPTRPARFFVGFLLLNNFHKQKGIRHSRSGTNRKIAIEGPKHRVLALISLSVITDLPAHLGSGPRMRAFEVFACSTISTNR